MGAHNDMDKMFEGETSIKDPGASGTITLKRWGGVCQVTTAAAEARTLDRPKKAGVLGAVALRTDGGDLTLTVTGGYNAAGETSIVMDDAGDIAIFYSVDVNGTFRWELMYSAGLSGAVPYTLQGAPAVIADGDTAMTIANLLTRILQMTSSTGARAPTVPTGTAVNGEVPVGYAIDWSFQNLGDQTVTITQATGHTVVGDMTIVAGTTEMFRTRVTAANTAVTYRIA